jgi:sec-independent protein translocase protein TatA
MMPIFANLMTFDNPIALIILALVVVLLFGTSKLATFGKSLGDGLREFKKATREDEEPKKIEPVEPPVNKEG